MFKFVSMVSGCWWKAAATVAVPVWAVGAGVLLFGLCLLEGSSSSAATSSTSDQNHTKYTGSQTFLFKIY
jgi:hypothetical protein